MRLHCAEKHEEEHSITFLDEETHYLVESSIKEEDLVLENYSFLRDIMINITKPIAHNLFSIDR